MILLGPCALVVLCILAAGLWPFHAPPKNDVHWLNQGEGGLFFGKYGSILSMASFQANSQRVRRSCVSEIWLEPR